MNNTTVDFLVVGGGAAGFFAAINYGLRLKNAGLPKQKIVILEKTSQLLKKVKISGGGRCNVTHACFEPRDLVKFYPRGKKELLSPFLKFSPQHTVQWFEEQGVSLKTEADGRMFPTTDNSQTIIDCFLDLAEQLQIDILLQQVVVDFYPTSQNTQNNDIWQVNTNKGSFNAKKLVLATGGSSFPILRQLEQLGLSTENLIPSLFTFNTKDRRLSDLSGIAVVNTAVGLVNEPQKPQYKQCKVQELGALLITHRGLSGPSILKMSAVAAVFLHQLEYQFKIKIDWCNHIHSDTIQQQFNAMKKQSPNKKIVGTNLFDVPKRLWASLVLYTTIGEDTTWSNVTKKQLQVLMAELKRSCFSISGKSTNKEEFVSCGGVGLTEIDFADFSVKKFKGLYVIGELLHIDALTGGFNFQAAWTAGYLVGCSD